MKEIHKNLDFHLLQQKHLVVIFQVFQKNRFRPKSSHQNYDFFDGLHLIGPVSLTHQYQRESLALGSFQLKNMYHLESHLKMMDEGVEPGDMPINSETLDQYQKLWAIPTYGNNPWTDSLSYDSKLINNKTDAWNSLNVIEANAPEQAKPVKIGVHFADNLLLEKMHISRYRKKPTLE